MASAFLASLSFSPPISPLPLKSNRLPSPNSLFFSKPHFISTPITVTNAKSKQRASVSTTLESDIDDDEVDDEDDDDEDDDQDEEFLAFEDMRKWELNKPSGFGEGKVYDTTVEEKLLEEMERERIAQLDAEKKKGSSNTSKKHEEKPRKDVIPSGPSVRLANLPKKKNIHRDLQAAFKGFSGIVKISPAISGNWKTRDPICKGFAFVELVSEEAATRFVNKYSDQDILFGKVQKRISYGIVNHDQSVNGSTQTSAQQKFTNNGDNLQGQFNGMPMVNKTDRKPALLMNGKSSPLSDSEEMEMRRGHFNTPSSSDDENESHVNDLNSNSLAVSSQKQIKKIASKKKVAKKKSAKTAKSILPSSMARLKTKDRSVLTGVFTKYGGKVTSVSD